MSVASIILGIVRKVCGVAPDATGNVPLGPSDVGADAAGTAAAAQAAAEASAASTYLPLGGGTLSGTLTIDGPHADSASGLIVARGDVPSRFVGFAGSAVDYYFGNTIYCQLSANGTAGFWFSGASQTRFDGGLILNGSQQYLGQTYGGLTAVAAGIAFATSQGTAYGQLNGSFTFQCANNSGSLTNVLTIGEGVGSWLTVFFPVQAPTASAPSYAGGAIYFDTTLNKLRIGGASGWETVTSA